MDCPARIQGIGLGYVAAAGLLIILVASFSGGFDSPLKGGATTAFSGMSVQDALWPCSSSGFFGFGHFLFVPMGVEYRDRIPMGLGEFFVITLISLSGMMFAASANDFVMVYVAIEMMSVSFYVLVSFQRSRPNSLEAGVKYLIMSASVGGIAGVRHRVPFSGLAAKRGLTSWPPKGCAWRATSGFGSGRCWCCWGWPSKTCRVPDANVGARNVYFQERLRR